MQNGGCHPVDGCQDGDGFAGADFKYLAANVVSERNGKTLFPAYGGQDVRRRQGRLHRHDAGGHAAIVTPSGVAGYEFLDEADTVNAPSPS